jgi:hypothetical protein
MISEIYGTEMVQTYLSEQDAIGMYVEHRLSLQQDGSLKSIMVERSLNFDAMMAGRKEYDDPEIESNVYTPCD